MKKNSKPLVFVVLAAFLVLALAASVSASDPTCPISYWKLDESSGSAVADSVGPNNGALVNTGSWIAGKVGNSLQFSSAGWVSMTDTGLPSGSNSRTVEAWIRTTDPGIGTIFQYGTTFAYGQLFLLGKNYPPGFNNIRASQWGAGVETIGFNAMDGNWHHIALRFSSGNYYEIYVDGLLRGSGYMTTNTVLSGKATIGAYKVYYDGTDPFIGQIDEVSVYNQALSVEEIQQHYADGLAGNGIVISQSQSCTVGVGACQNIGTQAKTCSAGSWSAWGDCSAVAGDPSPETCNGIDDDCDGSTDEYYACTWNGFFQPVDNLPAFNQVKAGSAIPVKFSLGGDMGLSIFEAGYPVSKRIACDSSAPLDVIEITLAAGGSSLTYNPVANQYIYVWKTDKSWAGTCRQLVVQLSDGTLHEANFKFK
ncbi:PxKF domain-containing protein [Candidatus Woesearchaeota archaeon]|nr:PxKF domain-containing protein [Candidatus Woesearchaeota archaeon]